MVRREFIDPFFKALGWDIDNERGYAAAYKEVIHEDAIKIGGSTKAPDYCFRIGQTRKFFLEAKRPRVDIKMDIAPAYQLRRYAWSSKLPLSILSDFEEFSIYDCRVRPNKKDAAANARIFYCTFDQYIEKWDEIFGIFSRDAVLKGSFDDYAESTKRKKGTSEVDDAFLHEIERWRALLARNFALRNTQLTVRDLNFAVQKTIDRMIFLRICEDRGSEDYGRLAKLSGQKNSYRGLIDLFKKADARYNSGLFHFRDEKDRHDTFDALTPKLVLDDRVVDQIVANLYYPESPYEFSVLPADILGQVYEQFLGKTIRLTKGHQAKIEEKPAVRKAGGVYYTPKFIVSHMVQKTIGTYLNGSDAGDPSPVSISQASKLKVLDPACGSGSFLIEAYQYILDWHRDQYTLDNNTLEIDDGKVRRHTGGKNPKLYQSQSGEYKLTTEERKRILLNNIYGVDVDIQAVEVTKLSLLLKVLEGETQQRLQRDFIADGQRILPDLGKNIQCGNSIIGHDFYDQKSIPDIDLETKFRINTFDWDAAFPDIKAAGGFDCVIGNPPYVDIKDHPKDETEYIFLTYENSDNRINLFATFVEKSFDLVRKEAGLISLIIPTSILAQSSYQRLRSAILDRTRVEELVRLPNESFGSAAGKVKVDTVIMTLSTPSKRNYDFNVIAYRGYERIQAIDKRTAYVAGKQNSSLLTESIGSAWPMNLTKFQAKILKKMDKVGKPLTAYVDVSLGLTPYDKYKGHTPEQIQNKVFHANTQRTKRHRKLLKGNDVRRYMVKWNGETWIDYGTWLGAPRERRFFQENRILVKQIIDWSSLRIWAALTDEELYNTQNAFNLLAKENTDLRYLIGVLNSKAANFYHAKKFLDEFKMRFQKILIKDCKRIPIPDQEMIQKNYKSEYVEFVGLVDNVIGLVKDNYEQNNPDIKRMNDNQIGIVERRLDKLVGKFYGLDDLEMTCIEEN